MHGDVDLCGNFLPCPRPVEKCGNLPVTMCRLLLRTHLTSDAACRNCRNPGRLRSVEESVSAGGSRGDFNSYHSAHPTAANKGAEGLLRNAPRNSHTLLNTLWKTGGKLIQNPLKSCRHTPSALSSGASGPISALDLLGELRNLNINRGIGADLALDGLYR